MASPDNRGRRTSGLRFDPEVRRGLKIVATMYGLTMEDYLDQLLRREIEKENIGTRRTNVQTRAV